jgi:hypothetical protein
MAWSQRLDRAIKAHPPIAPTADRPSMRDRFHRRTRGYPHLRIPIKPATDSTLKPATRNALKAATLNALKPATCNDPTRPPAKRQPRAHICQPNWPLSPAKLTAAGARAAHLRDRARPPSPAELARLDGCAERERRLTSSGQERAVKAGVKRRRSRPLGNVRRALVASKLCGRNEPPHFRKPPCPG